MRKTVALGLSVFLCSITFSGLATVEAASSVVHEQQALVDFIGRDISGMLLFAAGPDQQLTQALQFTTNETPSNQNELTYNFELAKSHDSLTRKFSLEDYLWKPANYAPWATQLMEKLNLKADKAEAPAENELINALADFDSVSLIKKNLEISTNLSQHPLNPAFHEEAALIDALYALRESAACFTDLRPWLNKITAQLAIASALRGNSDYSASGKLAEIVLLSLCKRQTQAMELIGKAAEVEKNSDAMKSWLRALKIRTTSDYRIADLPIATVVERLEYGRALADNLGADQLTDRLKKITLNGPAIDWLRIGMRGIASVESGHIYAEPAPDAELSDFMLDARFFKEKRFNSQAEAITELNQSPNLGSLITEPTPQLQAVTWSDLCAFHARQFLDGIYQKYYFENDMWGVKEDAKKFFNEAEKEFSAVNLFPLCKLSARWTNHEKADAALTEQLLKLISTHPEEVNSDLWHRITYVVPKTTKVPDPYTWFAPRILFGTAFDFPYRNYAGEPDYSMQDLDAMYKLAPYEKHVVRSWVEAKYGKEFTGEQLKSAYGALADYDVHVMLSIANTIKKTDKHIYAEFLEKIAKYNPNEYFMLGDTYVELKDKDKAVKAYENGVLFARDGVIVSNNCDWLVNYYYDNNMKSRALKLAQDAAEVYSKEGLTTLAKLYERMGQLRDAEEYYQKIQERYQDVAGLYSFYHKHENTDPRCKIEAQKLITKIFPHGIEKMSVPTTTKAPLDGVELTTQSQSMTKCGMKVGNIVVGINNLAVHSTLQYFYARDLNPKNVDFEFIVWTGTNYKAIKVTLPDHKLGCDIKDYKTN